MNSLYVSCSHLKRWLRGCYGRRWPIKRLIERLGRWGWVRRGGGWGGWRWWFEWTWCGLGELRLRLVHYGGYSVWARVGKCRVDLA